MLSARKIAIRFAMTAAVICLAGFVMGPASAQTKFRILWSEQQCRDGLAEANSKNTVAGYDEFISKYETCETQVAEARRKRSALVTGGNRGVIIKNPPPIEARPFPPSPPPPPPPPPPPAAPKSVVTDRPIALPRQAQPAPLPEKMETRSMEMRMAEIKPVFTDIGPTQLRIAANGGSAVVLFTTSSAAQARNRKVCEAIMKLFDSATIPEVEAGVRRNPTTGVLELLRPVYWLLVQDAVPAGKQKDCTTRLTLYNYVRANTIRDKLRLYGPGPYYVVLRENETQAGVMDLSRVRPEDMERMTLVFRSGFSQRDDIWDQTSYTAENRRRTLQSALGGIFPDEFISALGLVVDPFRNRGPVCTLGDLADRGCTRSAATRR